MRAKDRWHYDYYKSDAAAQMDDYWKRQYGFGQLREPDDYPDWLPWDEACQWHHSHHHRVHLATAGASTSVAPLVLPPGSQHPAHGA